VSTPGGISFIILELSGQAVMCTSKSRTPIGQPDELMKSIVASLPNMPAQYCAFVSAIALCWRDSSASPAAAMSLAMASKRSTRTKHAAR